MVPYAEGGDAPGPGLHSAAERCPGVHGQTVPRVGVQGRALAGG